MEPLGKDLVGVNLVPLSLVCGESCRIGFLSNFV